ncbi:acyl-CoA dehydrogenase family protein [Polyangium aurulentum]|uniref:acyl-CoA dehydrogenase family protein n=1 Tax=Polyangium aurulentum TaxID=2567896 RepID=UPI0010AE6001|nr:acyl-CoA dehydrogenase family protein [Polyangium aurulentum]UQA59191.1 acyl-CoA dehydrogenase family protein [Polyangium aurulentum]
MSSVRVVLSAAPDPAPFSTLADWWARYRVLAEGAGSSIDAAILGGFAGDRMAAAFAAGYQAALRALVPDLPSDRVVSFCVTEKGGGHPRAIATRLSSRGAGRFSISGEKRWATLSADAGLLLVVAKAGEDASTGKNLLRVARVAAPAPGLRLVPMPDTPFVPEIPHAEVFLDDVEVTEADLLPGDGYERYVKPFRTTEDLHVNAAVAGYLVREARLAGAERGLVARLASLLAALRELSKSEPTDPAVHVALAGILVALRAIVEEVAEPFQKAAPERYARFARDKAIFGIAESARVQRFERAWEQLAGG